MAKDKVKTGKIALTENPNLKGSKRFSVHLSHEDYVDLGSENTEVFSGQELLDDLASHHREEFREFLQKRAASIIDRRHRHRNSTINFTKRHFETVHPTR